MVFISVPPILGCKEIYDLKKEKSFSYSVTAFDLPQLAEVVVVDFVAEFGHILVAGDDRPDRKTFQKIFY